MSLFDHIYTLERVHHHIEHRSTDATREFTARLGISEGKLYRILEELRDLRADILYSAEKASYIYGNDVMIHIDIRIDHFDTIRTKGGYFLYNRELLPFLAVKGPKLVDDSYWASPNP